MSDRQKRENFFEAMEKFIDTKKEVFPTRRKIIFYSMRKYKGKRITFFERMQRIWNRRLSSKADFFVVSYVKSGRTWLRYFLAAYFSFLKEQPFKTGIISNPKKKLFIYFVHRPSFSLKGKKVIFLARDPRDVVISRYFQVKNKGLPFEVPISEFIRSEIVGISDVINYMNEWYEAKEKLGDFLLVKYENMDFSEILSFLRKDIDKEVYKKAIEFSSFENMKKLENKGSTDRLGTTKVRKGKSGDYINYLTKEDLEYVNKQMEKLNPAFGY